MLDSGHFVGRPGRAASRALVCDTADLAEAKPFQGLQEVRAWAEHAHALGSAAGTRSQGTAPAEAADLPGASSPLRRPDPGRPPAASHVRVTQRTLRPPR